MQPKAQTDNRQTDIAINRLNQPRADSVKIPPTRDHLISQQGMKAIAQKDTMTGRQTDIADNRVNWPRGQFSEHLI